MKQESINILADILRQKSIAVIDARKIIIEMRSALDHIDLCLDKGKTIPYTLSDLNNNIRQLNWVAGRLTTVEQIMYPYLKNEDYKLTSILLNNAEKHYQNLRDYWQLKEYK